MNHIKDSVKTAILAVGASLTLGSGALADSFNIDVSDDDIAVQADDAKLTEVLQELENRTGIPVKFVAETEERVTLDVALTDIENAISKLTPNHMIVRGKQDGKEVIKEVIIIPAESDLASGSSGSGSDFLPSGAPAAEIGTPQNPDGTNQPLVQPTDSQLNPQVTQEPNGATAGEEQVN